MSDDFEHHTTSLDSPATSGEVIVPNDTTDLPHATRGIYIGSTGSLAVVLVSGDELTLNGVQAGTIYPLRIARVRATGTTAAGLVGLR